MIGQTLPQVPTQTRDLRAVLIVHLADTQDYDDKTYLVVIPLPQVVEHVVHDPHPDHEYGMP